jgi:aminoglycoside phosphotransferase (APT) family kinase protein
VDWDAAGRGDRCQDLALLFYNVFAQADRHQQRADPEVVATLGARIQDTCGPERWEWFLTYEILLTLDFVAEKNPRHLMWRIELSRRVLDAYFEIVRPTSSPTSPRSVS